MFEYRSQPSVCRYQTFEPACPEDVDAFIRKVQSHPFDTPGTWFQFGIHLRDSDAMVGDIGAHFLADDPRQVEIGFTIAPSFQGRGYGTESVAGLIRFLLADCGKHRVLASVDPRNEACIKVLERVGMRREAHFRQSLWFKGEWVDDMVFAVLDSEWSYRQAPV